MLKILASADYHLGMKFAGYPSVQKQLAEARFLSLKRLVDTANESECALFLIAGDLFDRVSVSAKEVRRAAELLNGFQGRLATHGRRLDELGISYHRDPVIWAKPSK